MLSKSRGRYLSRGLVRGAFCLQPADRTVRLIGMVTDRSILADTGSGFAPLAPVFLQRATARAGIRTALLIEDKGGVGDGSIGSACLIKNGNVRCDLAVYQSPGIGPMPQALSNLPASASTRFARFPDLFFHLWTVVSLIDRSPASRQRSTYGYFAQAVMGHCQAGWRPLLRAGCVRSRLFRLRAEVPLKILCHISNGDHSKPFSEQVLGFT